jgi:hypothetical protein
MIVQTFLGLDHEPLRHLQPSNMHTIYKEQDARELVNLRYELKSLSWRKKKRHELQQLGKKQHQM